MFVASFLKIHVRQYSKNCLEIIDECNSERVGLNREAGLTIVCMVVTFHQ